MNTGMKSSARGLLLPILLALGACNMAISDQPMFSDAQRSSVQLRDGYWVMDDRECRFDAAQRAEAWPECADWAVIVGNRIVGERVKDLGGVDPALFIADGKPLILQMHSKPQKGEESFYHFAAIEPAATDADGRVGAFALWIVKCGVEERKPRGSAKVKPYPGFNAECRPVSVEALRAAAIASRPQSDELNRLKWVRAVAR